MLGGTGGDTHRLGEIRCNTGSTQDGRTHGVLSEPGPPAVGSMLASTIRGMALTGEALRGYLDYLRDMGVFDLYRSAADTQDEASADVLCSLLLSRSAAPVDAAVTHAADRTPSRREQSMPPAARPLPRSTSPVALRASAAPQIVISPPAAQPTASPLAQNLEQDGDTVSLGEGFSAAPSMPLKSFNELAPLPPSRVDAAHKVGALAALRAEIGDCTRCPLAYAGRHSIVFADGDPNASLMFVGEGPGADEDASGLPFVGKAGQLLNNMIGAMGLKREQVYIANIVMCRPPKNRTPEPVEANTCAPFLLQQIDIVQPKIIVALGSTAATYLLGVKQSLSALRGQWHPVRGAKCAVTYHPAYLLRDPKMKGEAWKDLQRVMVELGLKPTARA